MTTDDSVARLLMEGIGRVPDSPSIRCGDRVWSHRDLDRFSAGVASRLVRCGMKTEDRVAYLASREPEALGVMLGVIRAGCAAVPLDPSLPEPMRKWILHASGARRVVSAAGETVSGVEGIGWGTEPTDEPPPDRAGGGQLLYVLFTSGSTGVPKGVMMPHRAIANLIRWQQRVLPSDSGTRVLQFAAPGFDVMFQEVLTTWSGGGMLVLTDEITRRDPVLLWRDLARHRVTRLFLPVVALRQLASSWGRSGVAAEEIALRDVAVAGEALRIDEPVRSLFSALPRCRLHNHYGPTETHVVTSFTLAGDPHEWPFLPPIGRPIDGVEIGIESGRGIDAARGAAGELVVHGVAVARGYLGQEELTRERFGPTKEGAGGSYRTGDLARWNDADELDYLGRIDRQVKIRGVRIEPGEVEVAVSSHPQVQETAVIPVDRGGEKILACFYVVRRDGQPLEEALLRGYLKERLGPHAMPGVLRQVDSLPLTTSGKIDRLTLAAMIAKKEETETKDGPGSTETERRIAAIWAEVLGAQVENLDTGFFDAGGNSIAAVKVQQLLEERMGIGVAVADLFRFPTIASLAAHLDRGGNPGRLSARVAGRIGRMREAAEGVR